MVLVYWLRYRYMFQPLKGQHQVIESNLNYIPEFNISRFSGEKFTKKNVIFPFRVFYVILMLTLQ
jgi:hypothetical protein